ncbi:hypothetical protein EG327_008502 [Venturia inaequalis]|uniref:Uncharacterized protein n=1 Tax=Venturia inaequalis TaxID=5025 RepID=A0A8H3URL4_VENIN|nr:hypothetical protein EG327_008502 [Venturia inaequalis]
MWSWGCFLRCRRKQQKNRTKLSRARPPKTELRITVRFLFDEPPFSFGLAEAAVAEGVVVVEDNTVLELELELNDEEVWLASVELDDVNDEEVELEVDKVEEEVVLLDEIEEVKDGE